MQEIQGLWVSDCSSLSQKTQPLLPMEPRWGALPPPDSEKKACQELKVSWAPGSTSSGLHVGSAHEVLTLV